MALLPGNPLAAPGRSVVPQLSLEETFARLDTRLEQLRAREEFSGSVLIAQGGRIRFVKHCGLADFDAKVALSSHSSFSIASVTKPFTALGIMLLARAGTLTLDDRLGQYIPELPAYGAITIRQLLHHTSGIPDHVELAEDYWDPKLLLQMADLIELFRRHRPRPYFPPGEQFEYSNTGYAFLGEIIARVSKSTYPQFMAERVFRPLGMQDTAAFNLSSKECPLRERVIGFSRRFGRIVRRDLNFLDGVFGDGGIYASAEDLFRWDCGLRAGTLMPREVYREAETSGRLSSGAPVGYGFGWEIEGANVVGHWGEWEGFSALVRRDLAHDTLLVVLSNLGPCDRVARLCGDLNALIAQIDWSAATN